MRTMGYAIVATIAIVAGWFAYPMVANAYPVEITGPESVAEINQCNDLLPVYWDTVTHEIYGDQDGNGKLDGDDCNWK